ncbi:ABC transporter substrate-binding protein [Pseudactinotalea terrae]|uniref:ABC transporter substrate-binding protein n=1 Tax=Pseudactinotalea terrae TaxID=1743262 RepID=UPI0013915CAD|nr:extracellular solute-binding protein [Pseudactinotalea terrae]
MTTTTSRVRLIALATAGALTLAACGGGGDTDEGGENGDSLAGTTITLAGPNQWNSDPASFGPAWEALVAAFEAETGVIVETTVLPVDQFAQTLSTQLAAGTAPELVFNQAPHEPELVTPLNEYLEAPNPFIEGNTRWWDAFEADKYGPGVAASVNADGDTEFVPFNLVATGVFVNADIFAEVGLEAPIETWTEFIDGCGALREAGYTPFAMDNGDLGLGWTVQTISNMLFAKYYDELNVYAPDGSEGSSQQLIAKDWARAILSGELDATTTPEARASVELLGEFYDACVTENWSGVTPSGGGAVVGLDEFASGGAAMAWGVNFGYSALENVEFELLSMPFPTIDEEAHPLSTGFEAQYGSSTGGTSYMVPATTEGVELDAAIAFLQFVSAPEHIEPWLQETGGIPAVVDAEAAPSVAGFAEGAWGEQMLTGGMPAGPPGTTIQSVYDGYLLGQRDLDAQLAHLQEQWLASQRTAVEDNDWESEPWAAGP